MAKLTQEETAILNTLIYVETDIWENADGKKLVDVVKEIADAGKNDSDWKPGGGIVSKGEYEDIVKAVEKSQSLSQLEVLQVREEDYQEYHVKPSDARTLAFKNGDNPVVVFKGTEGEMETYDNFHGAYQTDTDAQLRALDYINILHDKYGFDNISVSGHSKGGNKAMYVTVRSDYIADCTAFDAQGFSQSFLTAYSGQIADKKDRITLYAPDKTEVSALLNSIAGNVVYLSTDGLSEKNWKLGMFKWHKPNVYYTVDAEREIRFQGEAEVAGFSRAVNTATVLVSAAACAAPWGMAFLVSAVQGYGADAADFGQLAGQVVDDYQKNSRWKMANWADGIKSDGSPALSTQIGDFLIRAFSCVTGTQTGELAALTAPLELGDDENVFTALSLVGERILTFAATADLPTGEAAVDGFVLVTGLSVWALVKILELVAPIMWNGGVAAAKIAGLAFGIAVSWVIEKLTTIGQAVIDGFCKAVDEAVRLGRLTIEGAKAMKDAFISSMKAFVSGLAGFWGNMIHGTADWIRSIFGSADAAIAYAQDIDVTLSRIDEMQYRIAKLCQCYGDVKSSAGRAGTVTGSVSRYYKELYVHNCCSDIQNNLKNALKYLDAAERALEKKRRALTTAVELYRKKDQEAKYIYG